MSEEVNHEERRAALRAADSARPPVRFSCPHCGMILEIAAKEGGVGGPCPGCRKQIESPPKAPPRPIAIKPRPAKPPRDTPAPPANPPVAQPFSSPPFAIPSLGAPPPNAPAFHPGSQPDPERPFPEPPVPRQPPISAPWAEVASTAEPGSSPPGQSEDSVPAVRSNPTSRLGRAVNPVTGISEGYQDRKDVIVMLKMIVAVVVTLGIVLTVVAITKKSMDKRTYDRREEAPKTP